MERKAALRRVGLVVLVGNVLLVAAKAAVWARTGSLALGSEAVNSLTDVAYSVVILGGLYLTTQPPDLEHPHGHERIEPFVSLFVAAGIFAAGGAILWRSIGSILSGSIAVAQGPAAAVVLVLSAAVKFGLYRYCLRVAASNNSPAVTATAVDNRNDILASVAALVGVLGAQAGYPILDPIAATLVAGAILYTGVEIVSDNVNYLVGAAPPDDLRGEIVRRALAHPEVEGVHDVVAHYVGPEIDVSLHIEVEGEHTLLSAHEIESEVIESIRDLDEVDDVFVHVDPRELGEWKDDYAEQLAARDGE
ncbi:cation diffusion facilitator family transporter [Natronoarchaeum philippinense]|uniref:Cation diffusion facilitator family transporter n=1 Tax=Natronoarchaeum philippinense TaxID=558529 RepID=A0A285NB10_NATPI|nr:cation diffusion facilitator family transporter [Natronoarchaeum philippinense]SNZ06655.1 cation diffusion facilitator family transporter [Natronoarchaeum philippinense]